MAEYSVENAIQRIAERTVDNTTELLKTRRQRRTEFTDLFGIPHTAQGDSATPAAFYISISKDMIYELQFCFKLVIQPFNMTVGNGGTDSALVTVKGRNLTTNGTTITPNPHNHETEPHNHTVISGITLIHTQASDFRVAVEGIDITAYLMEQHDGEWIDGEGIYPTNRLDGEDDFYDILDVATVMYNNGEQTNANKLLAPGFKRVTISSNAPFQATLYTYVKYSNMAR